MPETSVDKSGLSPQGWQLLLGLRASGPQPALCCIHPGPRPGGAGGGAAGWSGKEFPQAPGPEHVLTRPRSPARHGARLVS